MNSNQNTVDLLIPADQKLMDGCQLPMNPAIPATQYITNLLNDISGTQPQIKVGKNKEVYIPLGEEEFLKTVPVLSQKGFVLISLFCVQDFEENPDFTLFYVFRLSGFTDVFAFMRHVLKETTSVATVFPSACWYEREIRDGFGIEFTDAFDKRRLFLHEAYPEDFHPLLKTFKNGKIQAVKNPKETYSFKQIDGEGVYQIPVGPVHAGIIEPGHFRFSVIGEPIFNLEIRLFYKHRGIEKLAEGKTPSACVPIAEAISGDETVANAVAFCTAVEKIAGIEVQARDSYLRAILLEMERIYSHMGDLSGMITDIGFPRMTTPFLIQRENLFRQNELLTGSRFMRSTIDIGGMKKDISGEALSKLSHYLETFAPKFEAAVADVRASSSLIDRFSTTGVLKKKLIAPLNLTGPIARASGASYDIRLDHPYGIYRTIPPKKHIRVAGDVLARFEVKAAEVLDSVSMIRKLIVSASDYSVASGVAVSKIPDGYALSMVEAPRGQSLHWVYVKDGRIDRYKVRTASYCNWKAIEHAVLDNIVPDFPLINKSLNLSYAGTDL
ncbi:hydrogenase, group 4, HycE subunit, putative [Methanosarcina lacustris Z-7289]|uniref:Hydrogenase, group 4, HycE subunit, putative n=1 Tax=Methanosarcina lacustris Z-7289 TaxID=1434111 RepID=A0A0E3SAH7_9EURY|nr:NADH-quinone oxidoreductase subunit C [Methanosarcina lacustris]AKB76233.1 hydrogenase, group 4, HycE subunit, putative [Methanosarcina lacustris Z-7289]